MKVLFNKFQRGINLVALLLSNLGSKNKTTYSEFRNLKILRIFSYNFEVRRSLTYSLQYVESIRARLAYQIFLIELCESIGFAKEKLNFRENKIRLPRAVVVNGNLALRNAKLESPQNILVPTRCTPHPQNLEFRILKVPPIQGLTINRKNSS
jgi:hypothetical protein